MSLSNFVISVRNVERRRGEEPAFGNEPGPTRYLLPDDAPGNVDCGEHWRSLDQGASAAEGNWSHSWHFDDPVFAEDLFLTILGHDDRNVLRTRALENGQLVLRRPWAG